MSAPGPVRFVSELQLAAAKGQRISREVFGRTVTVLHHEGRFYAIDSACFHMGGPLGESGDIEELGLSSCIVCPWHGRKIDLGTGCQVDTDLSGAACASEDRKQRVYATAIDDAGWIWIDLSSSKEGSIPSDKYNSAAASFGSEYGYGLGGAVQSGVDYDMAAPLTPFAGFDRRALGPSPVKSPMQSQEASQQLPYRAQKSTSMRNANARLAVLQKMKPPVASLTPAAAPAKRTAQKTLKEVYARHAIISSMES